MIQRYSRALNNSSVSLSGAALPHCNFSNVGKAVEDCMRAVIGVLLNLTHDNGTPPAATGRVCWPVNSRVMSWDQLVSQLHINEGGNIQHTNP